MPLHPNWSVRFAEPITHLPPLFPRNLAPAPRRTMAQDLDLQQLFTDDINENTSPSTDLAISAADIVSADASASQNNTTSRRLRPRRAKSTTATQSNRVTPSVRSNRPAARSRTSKTSSRAASKKKAIRREVALAGTQAEQEIIIGTSTTTTNPASRAENTNI
jgi:hypothetical protein